jgi:alcohol dehydrogenase YqhD (iron-dependent ADH family)
MNKPATPTTCNMSDMLNAIASFVEEYPDWTSDPNMVDRVNMAYVMLTNMGGPDMTSQEEYDFVLNLHHTLTEARNG